MGASSAHIKMPDSSIPPTDPAAGPPLPEPESGLWKPGQGKALGTPEAAPSLAPQAPKGRNVWALLALACVIAGLVASYLLASSTANSDVKAAHHSFAHSTTTVAAAMKPALLHGEDLLTSAGTYFAHNAIGSPAEFSAWAKWARVLHTHAELQSLSLLALVRSPELKEFKERVAEVPKRARLRLSKASKSALSSFRISPPGYSSYHCLALAGVARTVALKPAAGIDYCAYNSALLGTRDTTATMYGTAHLAHGTGLVVLTPIYRGDLAPKTDLGRRAAFVGWLREVLDPYGLIADIRRAEPGLAIRLSHATPFSTAAFASGTETPGGLTAETNLHNGWTLRTFAPAPATGIFAHDDAVTALVAGALLSILFGALVFLLGAGRGPARQRLAAPQKREELYDQLTQLPNRGLTLDRAERMLARAGRQSGLMVGALFVDIDWFKDVNDKLGSEAGDQLLKTVGERLNIVVREHDTVGRYGGDEFVVLVESAARGMRLDSLARRIIESLHKPIELEGFGPSFCITASIGVAFGRYATPEDLLRDAHMALFAAKAAGKDRYTLFNANMRSVIEGRGVLEVDMNRALDEGEFNLLYQPIFDLNSQGVAAVESLLRWQHPTKGEIAPDDFIPLAEESGLIVPIGRWVLGQACTDAAAWNTQGHRVSVAVKVSANQLNRDGFATDVLRALQQSGLEPSLLILEIAETTVMLDATGASRRLADLRALGVRIAIDDFGSGYAYRADLQRMPIDFLKVDRSSLASSDDESYRGWLLEAILAFGRDLALTVIAKGVESQEQLWALKDMGCAMAQGYFMGEPAPAAAVEQLLGVSIVAPATAPAPSTVPVAPAAAAPAATDAPAPAPAATDAPAPAPQAPPAETVTLATPVLAQAKQAAPAGASAQAPVQGPVPGPATAAAKAAAAPAVIPPVPAPPAAPENQ
jgi:diguanylate cyclase (GGDEF)-like protein